MKRLFVLFTLPAACLGIYDMKWFDLNYWRCPFHNDGRWGFDASGARRAGGSWPQPLKNYYIFGAGPWIGTAVGSETLVTVGYNPNSGGTEMCPSLCRYWRENDSADRVYKYPGDWPPPLSRFAMAPQAPLSEMDLWTCFCDSNPENHDSGGRPLGVDVNLTVYGFSDSIARDLFFLKYELANASGAPLNGIYFGMVVDADIGSYSDDRTGLILNKRFRVGSDTFWVKNTCFFYDNDNIESPGSVWESGTPGAVALRLLRAPNNLGLTAFKGFTIEIDPVTDPEQYLTLKGYNHQTGEYDPYDSIDLIPGDKRALLATGPFDLAPNSVATLWYAVIGAPYGEWGQSPGERDTSELALHSWWAEQLWQRIFGVKEVTEKPVFRRAVYPNPCRLGTPLHVAVNQPVRIYDTQGRFIKELTGTSNKIWNGTDRSGKRVAAGIYFIRIGNGASNSQKVLIVRE